MPEAYSEAAGRHWKDANLLAEHDRICNADHLMGLAAECAIKAVMMVFPVFVGPDGRLQQSYQSHINALWAQLPLHNIQARFPGLAAILRASTHPFDDFKIDQRYSPAHEITVEALKCHKHWTQRVLGAARIVGAEAGQ